METAVFSVQSKVSLLSGKVGVYTDKHDYELVSPGLQDHASGLACFIPHKTTRL